MTKRTPLTLQDHQTTGADLTAIRHRLLQHASRLANAYGNTRPPATLTDRAITAVDRLRCERDHQFARDHPHNFDTHVYYGPAPESTRL
jgi:hypothetical protein